MFFGTTPAVISQYLHQEMKRQNPGRIFVPFAGNFVIEQIARAACPNAEIHSTDISIYSRAIGLGLTGRDFRLELKDCVRGDFAFLADKRSPLEKAAVVIMFTEIAKMLKKREKVPYYEFLYRDAVMNQHPYFAKLIKKLEAFRTATPFFFYGCDAVKLLDDVRKGDLVIYDPPVSENNSDYEKEYACLRDAIDFDDEPYTPLTDEMKLEILEKLNDAGAIVYYRTNNRLKDAPKCMKLCFSYKYKWTAEYCLYSNASRELWVNTWSPLKESALNLPIIGKDDVIREDSEVEVIPVKNEIGNHYRLMWVKKAQMLDSGIAFLVLIDKKLVGMFQLDSGLKFSSELIPINSDPAAPTSKYLRLSKLILHMICNHETLRYINEKTMWPHVGFTTRVFTNEPISMKYRGMFKLAERSEDTGSDYIYKLIYQNRDNLYSTRAEALKEWVKRYGNKTK